MRDRLVARKMALVVAGTVVGCALAAPRIGVLDLGMGAGTGKGAFGCPSDPAVFKEALASIGEVTTISGEDAARKDILARKNIDLLVVPTGSAWPMAAAGALVSYLREGGSLLTCGGYAFDVPAERHGGAWRAWKLPPLPAAKDPVSLPDAARWRASVPAGQSARVAAGADGGVEVLTDNFNLWCTGGTGLGTNLVGRNVLSFRVRSRRGAKKASFELDETDGSRWIFHFEVGTEWREIRAVPNSFAFWHDCRAKHRGKKGDRVNFDAVRSFSIGCGPGESAQGMPMSVEFTDLRGGVDPDAARRCVEPPQINTRTARIRDAIHPEATQVNAFDPSFELRHVARIATGPETDPSLPPLALDGAFTGFAAIAQLGVNGHGYSPNRCAWRPILEARAADGSDRGPAAAFVHHHSGTFAGSSWAIFGVDNADLFARGSPVTGDFLRAVAKKLLARVALNETTTSYACYRAGETAELQTRVGNFGKLPVKGSVRFTLRDEAGREVAVRTAAFEVPPGTNTSVTCAWPVGADASDYVAFSAELVDGDGKIVDREEGAFVVWNESVIAKGPRLAIDGTRFTLDGRAGFWLGAQTYWGQTAPTRARSPRTFDRDFRQMRAAGLRFTRLFLPWKCEADKRISDACVQLAQKHGLVIYHTQQNIDPMAEGEAFAEQVAHFREIAARYRAVPGFMIDIRNEPVMKLPPSWESAKRMRRWLSSCRAAAREGRPDVLVSVGWSQGWAGGGASKDPAWNSLDLDFTDRHYYGNPARMYRDLKDLDMRALGKPLTLPECGAKCHPTFVKEDPWGMGDTDESYSTRFRSLISHAFGLGATALFVWHWRDPLEGLFPCGLVHGTGVPRPTEAVFSQMAKTLGRLELAENAPDVAILLREAPRMTNDGRAAYLEKAYAVDAALLYWGANWSKITESAIGRCEVKLTLDADELPTDDAAALRREVGRRLRAAGCACARREGDPDELEVFRVPGKGAVGWMFWNGSEKPLAAERAGRRVTVNPARPVYLQVSDAGRIEVCEEL